jgi:hypothetical protein
MRLIALYCVALVLAGCTDREDNETSPRTASDPVPVQGKSAGGGGQARTAKINSSVVPVHVGGDAEHDACGGVSVLRSPGEGGGKHIEVRSGPGERFAVVDRLPAGAMVIECDGSGGWSGIVYGGDPSDPHSGCEELGSPIAERKPYRGPCRAGWIPSDAAEVVAG